MDLNSITIGQAFNMLNELFGTGYTNPLPEPTSLYECMVGKYVIVRSRNEGINAGVVEIADNTGVVLTEARRIWYHRPENKNMSWYEGVAVSGLSTDSKVSEVVDRKCIVEDYSLTECSDIAIKSIKEYTSHAQS